MMYDRLAEIYKDQGGELSLNSRVAGVNIENDKVKSVILQTPGGSKEELADYFISTIPLPELIKIIKPQAPKEILAAAGKLKFRAFISVCLIIDQPEIFPDTWIYIHSPEVKVGRIQNFKQWSPYLVPDPSKTTLGLEYFCFAGDELWQMSNESLIKLAEKELEKIGLGRTQDVIDGFVVKLKNVYPIYQIGYQEPLKKIINYLQGIKNLQIIGRGGIFRYNNMDHSILTGLYAARNILGGNYDILNINLEEEYHEMARKN